MMKKVLSYTFLFVLPFVLLIMMVSFFSFGPYGDIIKLSQVSVLESSGKSFVKNNFDIISNELLNTKDDITSIFYLNGFLSDNVKIMGAEKPLFSTFSKYVAAFQFDNTSKQISKWLLNENLVSYDKDFDVNVQSFIIKNIEEKKQKDIKQFLLFYKYKNQVFVLPVFNQGQNFIGGIKSSSDFFDLFKAEKQNSFIRFLAFTNDGTIVYHSSQRFVGTNIKDNVLFSKVKNKSSFEGTLNYTNLEDSEVYANYLTIPEYDMNLVVELAKNKFFDDKKIQNSGKGILGVSNATDLVAIFLMIISVIIIFWEVFAYFYIKKLSNKVYTLTIDKGNETANNGDGELQNIQNEYDVKIAEIEEENEKLRSEILKLRQIPSKPSGEVEIKANEVILNEMTKKIEETNLELLKANEIIMKMNHENVFVYDFEVALSEKSTEQSVIATLVDKSSELFNGKEVLFFMYDDSLNVASLFEQSKKMSKGNKEDIVLELPDLKNKKEALDLFYSIQDYNTLKNLLNSLYKSEMYLARPLIVNKNPIGIIVVLDVSMNEMESLHVLCQLLDKTKYFYENVALKNSKKAGRNVL